MRQGFRSLRKFSSSSSFSSSIESFFDYEDEDDDEHDLVAALLRWVIRGPLRPGMKFSYFIFWFLFRIIFAAYLRWRICNSERVPMQGPVILAANHASFLDPPLVGAALRRPLNYLARDTLFPVPVIGWLLRLWKVVPVDREGGGAAGWWGGFGRPLCARAPPLFPEGTAAARVDTI